MTRRGAQRIFVVTGRSLNRKTDAVTQAQACLQAQVVGLFDDCIEHTPRDSVMALATAARAAQADLTHCFSGAPNVAGEGTNIVQDGKLLPAALEAKRRGVPF